MSDQAVSTATGWVCVSCRARTPLESDVCAGCGRPFGLGLAEDRGPLWARTREVGLVVKELVVVAALLLAWRLMGKVALLGTTGYAHGLSVWHLERALHLPSELAVQREVLPYAGFVRGLDWFYLSAHILGLFVFLVWLYRRDRDVYYRWRNIVVAFTGLSLLIQLVPVAPPRLLPQLGFVDTALRDHTSVYGPSTGDTAGQFASIPSVHVGWAVLIAIAVVMVCTSRLRWLIVAYPLATVYVVVATGNHFWLDGVAACVLLAAVLGVDQWWYSNRRSTARTSQS